MTAELTKSEMHGAIAEGVDRAIWRMITGVTQMPSMDFWDTLEKAMERAFLTAAGDGIGAHGAKQGTQPKGTCGGCKFYHLDDERTEGLLDDEELHPDDYESECRRYPPVRGDAEYYGGMLDDNMLHQRYRGPVVPSIGWCGEWAQREAPNHKAKQ